MKAIRTSLSLLLILLAVTISSCSRKISAAADKPSTLLSYNGREKEVFVGKRYFLHFKNSDKLSIKIDSVDASKVSGMTYKFPNWNKPLGNQTFTREEIDTQVKRIARGTNMKERAIMVIPISVLIIVGLSASLFGF